MDVVKTIHLIKVGSIEMGEHELACIDSWKEIYPDWEIRKWGTKECLELISDCKFAVDAFNDRMYNFSIDYMRLKILYEYGGLYMDTDVFALKRIPDEYFEKAWLTWDDRFESFWTNNGTGCYTPPKNPIFKEFMEVYQSIPYSRERFFSSDTLDFVLEKHGLKRENRCFVSLEDQDLDYIRIVNRVQFGVNDYIMHYFIQDGREQYLLHGQVGSWANGISDKASIFYMVIDDDTTADYAMEKINDFINLKVRNDNRVNYILTIFVNSISNLRLATEIGLKLNWFCPRTNTLNKSWAIYPIGEKIPKERMYDIISDFLVKKFHRVFFTRDIESEIGRIKDFEKEKIANF